MYIFFDQVRVDCNRKNICQKFYSFERKGKLNIILNFDLSLSSFRVKKFQVVADSRICFFLMDSGTKGVATGTVTLYQGLGVTPASQ